MSEADEITAIAEALDAFPAQMGAGANVQVPIPPESKFPWAKKLHDRGARIHPDLAIEFPIPGDQPGMGRFNTPRWVSESEYREWEAGQSGPVDDTHRQALAAMLSMVDPNLADAIKSADAAGRAEILQHLEEQVPGAVAKLAEANSKMGVEVPGPPPTLVAYTKADGTTTMVTPKQAAAYEAKRKDKA